MKNPIKPIPWTEDQLKEDSNISKESFIKERIDELKSNKYEKLIEESCKRVRHVLNATKNLFEIDSEMAELLNEGYLDVLRYFTIPPTSEADLKKLAGVSGKLSQGDNPNRIAKFITLALDNNRFEWIETRKQPTYYKKQIAIYSTAVLMGSQLAQTNRRMKSSQNQVNELKRRLIEKMEFKEVQAREITTVKDAPQKKEFCGESLVAAKKADVVIGLGDDRFMCIECKVSNSFVNSVKRLNHETVEKANYWYEKFGDNGVVCASLLRGCFKVDGLLSAQNYISIFWSHNIDPLQQFIKGTYEEAFKKV